MKSLRLFIQLSRPWYVLSAILLYSMGIGISHYLNGQINWSPFFIGLACTILVLLGAQYFNEYFDPSAVASNPSTKRTPFSGVTGAIGEGKLPRSLALWAGLTCFAITTSLTVLVIKSDGFNIIGALIFGIIIIAELLSTLPPARLISTGYGELVMSIIVSGLIPAFAYTLQGNEFHRILIMVAFPLTTLHIGMLLALEFPDYASDLIQGKRPILVRIGWQRGMLIHNILVLASFVLLGMAIVIGLPVTVVWPVFFVVPIGLFQVWLMNRIADGAKPNWNLLVMVAVSSFGLAAYLLTFAFWTH